MRSTAAEPAAPVATAREPVPDAAVRIVYNAVRALIPERGHLALADLLAVTRLEPETAAAAMDRLAHDGPLSINRLEQAAPAWDVRRTDR